MKAPRRREGWGGIAPTFWRPDLITNYETGKYLLIYDLALSPLPQLCLTDYAAISVVKYSAFKLTRKNGLLVVNIYAHLPKNKIAVAENRHYKPLVNKKRYVLCYLRCLQ